MATNEYYNEYMRNKRRKCREDGVCVDCMKVSSIVGEMLCQECKDIRNRNRRYNFDKLKAKGICTSCKLPVDREGEYCCKCLIKRREDRRKRNV